MNNTSEYMQEKLLDAINPESEYTIDQFYEEFSSAPKINPYKIGLKFVNTSNNPTPEYATDGASGFDLRANLPDSSIELNTGEFKMIKTGLYFEIPENFEIQIRSRSGLSLKYGISVLNGIGTVK